MEVSLKLKKNRLEQFGKFFVNLGFLVFCLTFWLNDGFFLGGDSTILGPKLSSLEVIFPYAGLGIFLVFLGNVILKKEKVLTRNFVLFLLFFLGFLAINSLMSFSPEVAILYLILWAVGFLATTFGNSFFIVGERQRTVYLFGIFLGVVVSKIMPELDVSANLLAVAAVLGMTFLLREKSFPLRPVFMIFYSWVVYNSYNFWLVLFAIFLFWFSKLWLTNGRKKERNMAVFLPIIFMAFLLGYGIYEGDFSFALFRGGISEFMGNPLNVLFGAGSGQFLVALQDLSSTILIPEFLKLPLSGALHSFYEFGLLGVLFLITLIFSPRIFDKKGSLFFPILFLFFWVFISDFFALENAILFAMVFLFVGNGRKLEQ